MVEHAAIDALLCGQAFKRVLCAFDFVSDETPIDHGDVDSHLAATETKLFDDECLWVAAITCGQLLA
jgi:hypothetical protein